MSINNLYYRSYQIASKSKSEISLYNQIIIQRLCLLKSIKHFKVNFMIFLLHKTQNKSLLWITTRREIIILLLLLSFMFLSVHYTLIFTILDNKQINVHPLTKAKVPTALYYIFVNVFYSHMLMHACNIKMWVYIRE